MSCASEIKKLHNIFGGSIIDKDFIINKQTLATKHDILVLLGFYSPWHWSKYKHLFSQFKKVIIILTGTDILHLSNEKITANHKQEMFDFIQGPHVSLCTLNKRNRDEVLQIHSLNSHIFSLPLCPHIQSINLSCQSNKIACYVGNNLNWYCVDKILQVARLLPEFIFYVYKINGFSNDDLNDRPDNVILNKDTIVDIVEFMKPMLCSLRITVHDGEPMTGIESMLLNKPFLFNHEMPYCEKINNNTTDIANVIKNIKPYTDDEFRERYNYYMDRNSCKSFERNYRFHCLKIIDKTTLEQYSCYEQMYESPTIETVDFPFTINSKYTICIIGKTSMYVRLLIDNAKNLDTKYGTMKPYETCTYITFVTTKNTNNFKLIVATEKSDMIFIDSMTIYQIKN